MRVAMPVLSVSLHGYFQMARLELVALKDDLPIRFQGEVKLASWISCIATNCIAAMVSVDTGSKSLNIAFRPSAIHRQPSLLLLGLLMNLAEAPHIANTRTLGALSSASHTHARMQKVIAANRMNILQE